MQIIVTNVVSIGIMNIHQNQIRFAAKMQPIIQSRRQNAIHDMNSFISFRNLWSGRAGGLPLFDLSYSQYQANIFEK